MFYIAQLRLWLYYILLPFFISVSLYIEIIVLNIDVATIGHILILGLSHQVLQVGHFFLRDIFVFFWELSLHVELVHGV